MRKGDGYKFIVGFVIVFLVVMYSSVALALPTVDASITDPYDTAADTVTLPKLTTVTVNNSPVDASTEHNHNVNDNGVSSLGTNSFLYKTTSGPHGRFTDNTASCGRCHALHTAKSQRLIRFQTIISGSTANNTIYGTCTFCHSFNGQSTYDVRDGMIWDTNDGKRYATNGGGFERMLVVEGEPEVATVVKASSSHRVNYAEGTKFRIPGAYAGTDTNMHLELTCSACHNPHGSTFSRLLRSKILVPDSVSGTMQLKNSYNSASVKIDVQSPFGNEVTKYNSEMSYFCSTCHQDYMAGSLAGGWDDTKHRHPGMYNLNTSLPSYVNYNAAKFNLPTATDGGSKGTLICLTCHYAHGTFVRVNGIPTFDSIVVSSADNSVDLQNLSGTHNEPPKNLRMDNRGVCQNCHNWTSVSQNGPQLTDVLDPTKPGTDLYNDAATLKTGVKALSSNSKTIVIRFNQYVLQRNQANSAEYISNYVLKENGVDLNIAGNGATATIQPDGKTVLIRLQNAMVNTKTYTLTVSNVQDTNFVMMSPNPTSDVAVSITW